MLTHGSLFSGVGGFEEGAERAGIKTLWNCEFENFQRSILKQHYKDNEQFTDVRTANISTKVDIISGGRKSYDILLFDWGGASLGNSNMRHFCRYILNEAIEKPSRIYIMVSTFTADAMKEALDDFQQANGELPANVFLKISDACRLLVA